MARYVELLLARNQRLNLTRIVEPAEVERRHLLDSLTCALPCLDAGCQLQTRRGQERWRCIDVGSGGGLPGIPLAIAFPAASDDAAGVGREEGGVPARGGRRAGAARRLRAGPGVPRRPPATPAERDAYDLVVARALAPLPVALELCLPFARPGGHAWCCRAAPIWHGQLADGEAAAEQLAARLRPPIPLDDPELPPGRSLVVADKLGPTPERFPRRPGIAAKRPLAASR